MDPTERARLRFQDMLMSAELAAERVAQDRPGVIRHTSSAVAVTRAMNRAEDVPDVVEFRERSSRP